MSDTVHQERILCKCNAGSYDFLGLTLRQSLEHVMPAVECMPGGGGAGGGGVCLSEVLRALTFLLVILHAAKPLPGCGLRLSFSYSFATMGSKA